jgi:hypothetical protein
MEGGWDADGRIASNLALSEMPNDAAQNFVPPRAHFFDRLVSTADR